MNRFQQLMCAAALGAAFAPNSAHADPPEPGKGDAKVERKHDKEAHKEARKEARDDRKEFRKEARDDRKEFRKEAHDDRKEFRKEAHDERREGREDRERDDDDDHGAKVGHMKHGKPWKPSPEFIAKMKERHESRMERRDDRRKNFEKKWGDFARGKPAITEFRLHGWRMAKLRRMRLLADELGKDALVAKVDKLIEKEEARHDKALEKLKEGAQDAKSGSGKPKPEKVAAPAPKPKPPTPPPAKAAKEGE
jgi:hypothetical protein